MAIKHRAFTFYPSDFFREIERELIVDGVFSTERLYSLSKAAAANPSVTMARALRYIRYDEEWHDLSDPDIYRDDYYLLVLLATQFKAAPDLSSSLPYSFWVLRSALPRAGWDPASTERLIRGKPYEDLLKSANIPQLSEIGIYPQFEGGWLDEPDISELYSKLTLSQELFCEPTKELFEGDTVVSISKHFYLRPNEVVRKSFFEAMSMLYIALQRKSALFLIID